MDQHKRSTYIWRTAVDFQQIKIIMITLSICTHKKKKEHQQIMFLQTHFAMIELEL